MGVSWERREEITVLRMQERALEMIRTWQDDGMQDVSQVYVDSVAKATCVHP